MKNKIIEEESPAQKQALETGTVGQGPQNFEKRWKAWKKEQADKLRAKYLTDSTYRQKEIEPSRRNRKQAEQKRMLQYLLQRVLMEWDHDDFKSIRQDLEWACGASKIFWQGRRPARNDRASNRSGEQVHGATPTE